MGELREYVLERDGDCFARRDLFHACRLPLTLEHVVGVHSVTDPRRDDERHTITLCWGLNGVSIASHELREAMRERLRSRYPDCA
jgi:hypothetical protein